MTPEEVAPRKAKATASGGGAGGGVGRGQGAGCGRGSGSGAGFSPTHKIPSRSHSRPRAPQARVSMSVNPAGSLVVVMKLASCCSASKYVSPATPLERGARWRRGGARARGRAGPVRDTPGPDCGAARQSKSRRDPLPTRRPPRPTGARAIPTGGLGADGLGVGLGAALEGQEREAAHDQHRRRAGAHLRICPVTGLAFEPATALPETPHRLRCFRGPRPRRGRRRQTRWPYGDGSGVGRRGGARGVRPQPGTPPRPLAPIVDSI
jgi:hypothetical protein